MKRVIKIKDAFAFLKKSKIKAGDGLEIGNYPFYTSSSVLCKYLDSYEIEGESLIFGTGGSASVHHSYGNFSTSTDCFVIQSNNKYEIDLRFVYLFLSGNIYILENGFKGAGLKHISKKYLEDVEIPLLPIERQKKIVEVLDKAQGLIDARKEQIELMDELIQSVFYEMFGDPVINPRNWDMIELSKVADIKIGPFGSLLHKEDYISGGHGLVNPSHIVDGKIRCDEKLTISTEKYVELASYNLKSGDLVLGRRGEMGRCAVVIQEGLLCGTGSIRIRCTEEISSFILQKIISFPTYKRSIEDKAVGQTMPNLNVPIVSKFEIPRIPKEFQDEYIKFVDYVDKLKIHAWESLDETQVLFNSLMQKYFE